MNRSQKKEIARNLSKIILDSDYWICLYGNGDYIDVLGHSNSNNQFEDEEDEVVFLLSRALHMNPELRQKIEIALDIYDKNPLLNQ